MKDGCVSLQGTPNDVWAADPDLQITSRHLADIAGKPDGEACVDEAEIERKRLQKLVEEKKKEEEKGSLNLKEYISWLGRVGLLKAFVTVCYKMHMVITMF